jgi:hypothetical protein
VRGCTGSEKTASGRTMPDLSLFQPAAAIAAAVIGAIVSITLTLLFTRKQKRVTFWVSKSEDLTGSLRKQYPSFRLVVGGGHEVQNQNRATVRARHEAAGGHCGSHGRDHRHAAKLRLRPEEWRQACRCH